MTRALLSFLPAAAVLAACAGPPTGPGAGAGTGAPPAAGVATPAPGAPPVVSVPPAAVAGTGSAVVVAAPGAAPPRPAPPAAQPRAGEPNWFAARGLFGADDPPDSVALGSASADGTFPGFGQPTGPRSQRFIQRLQF